MKRRFAVIFSVIFAVYLLLNGYIGWQGAKFIEEAFPGFPPAVFWVLLAFCSLTFMLGRFKGPSWMQPFLRLLKVIGSYYFAVFEFAVLLIPLAQLAGLLLSAFGIQPPNYTEIAGWIVLGLITALMLWGSAMPGARL